MPQQWSSRLYEGQHSFVWKYGEELLPLLNPRPGETILDIGCGTGQLTAQIADYGVETIGLDSSAEMIAQARQNFPKLKFVLADARDFHLDNRFDAVFSNAALHWVPQAEDVIRSAARVLKPGGRFVAEFGGKGNVASILGAVGRALSERGYAPVNPWYFPSIGEYSSLLEAYGFDVRFAQRFERRTELEALESGLRDWMEMFGSALLKPASEPDRGHIIREVEDRLRPVLHQDGRWHIDYVRLRVAAVYSP
jgi:trans-aconitate 2-methyltransferase